MLNKIGHKIEPWGTPDIIASNSLCLLFIWTHCLRSFRESLLNSYTESFLINKSCGMQSKALERSANTASATELLSKFFLHSSIILVSTCWVLYDFLYACKKGERSISILETRKVFENFSEIFEKGFKILTDRKFETEWELSVFSSTGLTQATLALLGKMLCLKLLLIAIESGVLNIGP